MANMDEEVNRYVPLDGTELVELIAHEVKERVGKDGRFNVSMAFHNPKIRFALIVEQHGPEGTPDYIENTLKLTIEDIPIVYEPDRVRDELGLGTYRVRERGGLLVDVKETENPEEMLEESKTPIKRGRKTLEEKQKEFRERRVGQ